MGPAGLGGSIYTHVCIFGSARAETETKADESFEVGKHDGGCLVSLLHPPWSFPSIRTGSQPSETHARNLGIKLEREGAGVTILAAGMGHSACGGDHICPFPAPRCTKHAPHVSLAEYPKNAALEQPYTYINIYYI